MEGTSFHPKQKKMRVGWGRGSTHMLVSRRIKSIFSPSSRHLSTACCPSPAMMTTQPILVRSFVMTICSDRTAVTEKQQRP